MKCCSLSDETLTPQHQALLRQYGFDAEQFDGLRQELTEGRFPPSRNCIGGTVAPPAATDTVPWPASQSPQSQRWAALGDTAMAAGQVAFCLLNGGMATRFGGKVKGVVDVLDGQSFLALRLQQLRHLGHPVPVFVMNSFATHGATVQHLEEHGYFGLSPSQVHTVTQHIAIRLTPEGELFCDHAGEPSFYAPGHGDIFSALGESQAFADFVANGGKHVMIANVDNLFATLSPVVLGAHIEGGRKVTVEVARKEAGDAGGAPARVNGRLEVVEGFRFPRDFDASAIPVFNTNTMVVDADCMSRNYPLDWLRADKTVDGRPAVQFERLMGQITAFEDSTFLEVPRSGQDGRFLPIKTPQDLADARPMLSEWLQKGP